MIRKRLIGVLVAAFVAGSAAAAVPTQVTSSAGEVRDVLVISATVGYASTAGGGLWKTSDAGVTWTKTTLAAKYVWKIAANPNSAGARLYAATDSGVFRSTDSGANWTQLTFDVTKAVAVSPGSGAGGPDTVFVGVKGMGILRSTDSGVTFTRQSNGLDSTNVVGLAFPPGSSTTLYAVLYCNIETQPTMSGNWGGAYRAINATSTPVTWTALNSGIPSPLGTSSPPCLTSIAANTNTGAPAIVVGEHDPNQNHGQFWHVNNASPNTWIPSNGNNGVPFGVMWVGPDFSNSNGFFGGTLQVGPYRSTDGGATFGSLVTAGTDPDMVTTSYGVGAFTSSVFVSGANGIGIFRTTVGASPWSLPTTPIKADRVNDIANHDIAAPSTMYMALKNGGVMKTTNNGVNWAQFNTGFDTLPAPLAPIYIRDVSVVGADPNNTSIVGVGLRPNGLFQLSLGTTWAAVTNFTTPVDNKPQAITINGGGRIFYTLFDPGASTPGGLFSALTFNTLASANKPIDEANPGLGVIAGSWRVRLSPGNANVIYFVTYSGVPYRSGDGGGTWARISPSTLGLSFLDVSENRSNANIVVGVTNQGIWRSTDAGANFAQISTAGLNETALAAIAYNGGTLIGGDHSGVLYCSTDNGSNWSAVTGGNLGAAIRELKYMNGTVQVLTDGAGVWRKDSVCP